MDRLLTPFTSGIRFTTAPFFATHVSLTRSNIGHSYNSYWNQWPVREPGAVKLMTLNKTRDLCLRLASHSIQRTPLRNPFGSVRGLFVFPFYFIFIDRGHYGNALVCYYCCLCWYALVQLALVKQHKQLWLHLCVQISVVVVFILFFIYFFIFYFLYVLHCITYIRNIINSGHNGFVIKRTTSFTVTSVSEARDQIPIFSNSVTNIGKMGLPFKLAVKNNTKVTMFWNLLYYYLCIQHQTKRR